MRKQKLPFEIITKEHRYDAAIVSENGTLVEVAFDMNSDTLEPRDITYRLLTHVNDPLARWLHQDNVTNYVSKDGIDEAIRVIAKQVRKQKSFINNARKHPAYKTMKSMVNFYVQHYKADFRTHDCMALGKDFSRKFIWMVRNTGTHILFYQGEWTRVIIENEMKSCESKAIFWYDGSKFQSIERKDLVYYSGELEGVS